MDKKILKKLSKERKKIDGMDKLILSTLGKRFKVLDKISKIKAKAKLEARQNNRYEKMLKERIKRGKKILLEEKFIKDLFHLIHEESIRLQKNKRKTK